MGGVDYELELEQLLHGAEREHAGKAVLSGTQLLAALESGTRDVDANVAILPAAASAAPTAGADSGTPSVGEVVRALPAGLRVRGMLVVATLANSEVAFPPGLHVHGGLHVWHEAKEGEEPSGTLRFGKGLRVDGSLGIEAVPLHITLPEGLRVGGQLLLVREARLTGLPRDFTVHGMLIVDRNAALEERYRGDLTTLLLKLRAALGPDAGLWLRDWTTVPALPQGFNSVSGDLRLEHCQALTSLPHDLYVGGDLVIARCDALTSLPRNLGVGGNLKVKKCQALRELPDNLRVDGRVQVLQCIALASLPRTLRASGGLQVQRCRALTSIQGDPHVDGDVVLRDCQSLQHLPQSLRVGGSLDLRNCRQLESLPQSLHVGGDLIAAYCRSLKNVPGDNDQREGEHGGARFTVGGVIDLTGCRALEERHQDDMSAFLRRLHAAMGPGAGLKLGWWRTIRELPGDLKRVGGDLCLEKCDALTSLPQDLCVGGAMKLLGCKSLETMLGDVEVGGNLDLRYCGALTTLPRSLRVGGDLDLSKCGALVSLPRAGRFTVGGTLILPGGTALEERHRADTPAFLRRLRAVLGPEAGLRLGRWATIQALPESFNQVGGDLGLGSLPALTRLPARLHLGGDFIVGDLERLARMPDVLYVGGNFYLDGAPALTRLPREMHVDGYVSVRGCPALAHLPQKLHAGRGMALSKCHTLRSLPANLHVHGHLQLIECHAVVSLPENLHVGDLLHIEDCPALTSLPQTLHVEGPLLLKDCDAIASLPENLDVQRHLTLTNCRAFTQLPTDLRAIDFVKIADCHALARLPEHLRVRGLHLSSCHGLTSLPRRLHVAADLVLQDCPALESLPASMLEWPLRDDTGRPHNVRLEGTGLSPAALEWLRGAEAPGLRFHVSLESEEEAVPSSGFAGTQDAVAFWASEASAGTGAQDRRRVSPTLGLQKLSSSTGDAATLVRFLSRLRDAKEFGIAETRKALAKRVVAVLELLSGDDEHREELLLRMSDSLDACGDKPVWALNQMHLVVEVAKARESAEQLRDLGRRVMRLMVVHEHAKRKVDSLRWVDDVCVYLRFEIDLREALDLPVDATAMIFPSYIKIEDAELEAAKDDALAITDEQFEAWLAAWPEWQRHQRHQLATKIVWSDLPEVKQRASLRKRASRRLSRLLSLSGDKMADPVTLDFGKSVWGLGDLVQHWERTGLDFHSSAIHPDQLGRDLHRVVD